MKTDFNQLGREYIELLGGKANIANLINCGTRLRVMVNDLKALAPTAAFQQLGAIAVTHHQKMVQVIVGLDVPQIQQAMHAQLSGGARSPTLDEYGLTQDGERAQILFECLGLPGNVQLVTTTGDAVLAQVADPAWVDSFDVMLQLDIGITSVDKRGHQVYIYMAGATGVAKELNKLVHRKHRPTG